MMQSKRSELLDHLARIGELAPNLRLGQLIALLTDRADTPYTASPVADIEDEEILEPAREFLATLLERSTVATQRTTGQVLRAS